MTGRYFVQTFGCQMNERDSTLLSETLARGGWEEADRPESADLVVVNTCSVREKGEDKLFSLLGRLRQLKLERGLAIGVAGCIAQQLKGGLVERAPFVDFVLGPDQLGRVAEVAAEAAKVSRAVPSHDQRSAQLLRGLGRVETAWASTEEYLFPAAEPGRARGRATAFVTATKGCDNVCSFCIVPHTRGREVSRQAGEIVAEVASLAAVGLREVTLVGQNVNSYAGGCTFAALLRRVAEVPGIARIRFTTSHPMDLSDDLIDCFAPAGQGGIPQLMPHFHLPVQHGSDAVLRRMRRTGTVAEYEARVARLFAVAPGLALTSDIICGFPGETEEEHAATLALLGRVPFDALFSFVYSRRPHTSADAALERNERAAHPSADWAEVPREVAHRRLDEVQALQKDRTLAHRRACVGREVEVLVENLNPVQEGAGGGGGAGWLRDGEGAARRYGRSRENCGVHFTGDARVGDVVRVRVERASLLSLSGIQVGVVAPTNVTSHRLTVLHS